MSEWLKSSNFQKLIHTNIFETIIRGLRSTQKLSQVKQLLFFLHLRMRHISSCPHVILHVTMALYDI